MKNKLNLVFKAAPIAQQTLPLWRASFRMALVTVAGLLAAGLMATGMTGCADMSSIDSKASLRDASSLGLPAANASASKVSAVSAEWWRDFGDRQLDSLIAQALQSNPSLKLAQARLARAHSYMVSLTPHASSTPPMARCHRRWLARFAIVVPRNSAPAGSLIFSVKTALRLMRLWVASTQPRQTPRRLASCWLAMLRAATFSWCA